MNIRDRELLRLEKYANGLGIKVTYRKLRPESKAHAEWTVDGKEIILYLGDNDAKITTVLNFIHELGHHMHHVYNNRERNKQLEKALLAEANRSLQDPPIGKRLRKMIYEDEVEATKYREQIIHEVGVKISSKKIKLDIELDCWIYYTYYATGDFPSKNAIKQKRSELNKLLKEK